MKIVLLFVAVIAGSVSANIFKKPTALGAGLKKQHSARICNGAVIGDHVHLEDNSVVLARANIKANTAVPKDTYVMGYPTTYDLFYFLKNLGPKPDMTGTEHVTQKNLEEFVRDAFNAGIAGAAQTGETKYVSKMLGALEIYLVECLGGLENFKAYQTQLRNNAVSDQPLWEHVHFTGAWPTNLHLSLETSRIVLQAIAAFYDHMCGTGSCVPALKNMVNHHYPLEMPPVEKDSFKRTQSLKLNDFLKVVPRAHSNS